jgi:hypothetical protein
LAIPGEFVVVIIDKSQRSWIVFTLVATVLASVAYVLFAWRQPDGWSAGSWAGMTFGIAGSLLMLYAGLLSVRKRLPRWPWLGSAHQWTVAHVWLGLLSGPLIFFHAGFRWGGPLEQWAMGVFLIVYLSGIVGLILQQFLPHAMTALVPAQAIFEQIPKACAALQHRADVAVAERCGTLAPATSDNPRRPEQSLVQFYVQQVRGRLAWPAQHAELSESQLRWKLQELRQALPLDLHDLVDQLLQLLEERKQLDWQWRIHGWLHGWLLVHVPLSVLLLVLALAHVVASVWY